MLLVDVSLHLLLSVERPVAHRAAVASLAKVLEAVQFQHVVVAEISQAYFTGVGPLSGVRARVHLQLFGASEALPAAGRRTPVGFLAGVRAEVDHQLSRLYEGLVAVGAGVRPLARVDPGVAMQLAGVLEGGPADSAAVGPLLGVYPPVHLQVLFHAEHLVTVFAFERSLAGVCPVVADQPRRDGECFVTDITAMGVGGGPV